MNYNHLDWLVVLGARVGLDEHEKMQLSHHMCMRARSAVMYNSEIGVENILVCGGPSFYIRYPPDLSEPTFAKPDFSEEAKYNASYMPSESAVISLWLNGQGVSFERMFLEQESRTTTENAIFGAAMIQEQSEYEDYPLEELGIGILSMVYHLNRPDENTMEVFALNFIEHDLPKPTPVYTEEILYAYSADKAACLEEIREFYQKPQSHGWLWDGDEICRRLQAEESLMDLKPIKRVS